jgi:hypothetical protein
MRVKTWLVLSIAAFVVSLVVPTAADAGVHAGTTRPYYMTWKPGTPLPRVPAGYRLEALPPGPAMFRLRVGSEVPMVAPRAARASAGLVNLEALPKDTCVTTVYRKFYKRATAVAQAYTKVNGIYMHFI